MPKRVSKSPKSGKKLSAYNIFVKKMIPKLIAEAKQQGKVLKATEAMKLAAFYWKH